MKFILILLPFQILTFVLKNDNEFQLYSQDLILGNKPLIVGSFSKFSPFYNTPNIGEILNQSQDQFLVFYLQELTTNEIVLFHYVQFDKLQEEIYHILNVKNQDGYYEMKFKMNTKQYESMWHFFYLYISNQINEDLVCGYMQSLGYSENIATGIKLLQQSQYLIVVGGSLTISKNGEILNLKSYLGKLQFFFDDEIQENVIQEQNYLQNIFNYIDECKNSNEFQQLQFMPTQFKNFNTGIPQMNEFYFVQFWFQVAQIKQAEKLIKFNVICITIKNPYIDIQLQVFQLTYLIYQQDFSYNIEYQSYRYPYFTEEDEIIKNSQGYSMDSNLIFQWHLITLNYQSNQISLEIKNFQSDLTETETIQNVYQFSSSYQLISIGDQVNEYFQSTVESISFNNCPFSTIINHCHFTCQTCFGPFRINCLTCAELSNRIYNSVKYTCSCQLFYLEEGKTKCKGLDSTIFNQEYLYLPAEPNYDQIEPNIICSYGYFNYKEKCIQCPSAAQQNMIGCVECIQNPQEWVIDFSCHSSFKHLNNDLNAIYYWIPSYHQFLIHDLELISLNSFNECNSDSTLCYEIGFDDQNPILVECDVEDGYFWWSGNCIQVSQPSSVFHCVKGCAYCLYDECQYCQLDKYFMSHLDSACYLCLIPNCKYCFQYNIYNHEDVSAKEGTTLQFSTNFEDYVIGCSLCYNNYIFDFSLNECVEKTLQLPCLNGYLTQENNFICTSYQDYFQGILQQKQSCIELIPFCFKCIKDKYGMSSCVQCIDGYYLDLFTSVCLNCNIKFQNVITCQMTSSRNDNWKFEVESFYLNFLPSQSQLLIMNNYFVSNYDIKQCSDGLTIIANACIELQEQNCYLYETIKGIGPTCVLCDSLSHENEIFSYFNLFCQICPYPCLLCQESTTEQITAINSEFILDDDNISQTYQCLMQSEERQKTYLSTENFNIQQRDQNGLRLKIKIIEAEFSEKLFQSGMSNLDLLIRKKIHTYVAKLNSTKDFQSDSLKKYIFTLQNMTLIYDGTNDTNKNDIITILDFDSVSINNLTFLETTNRFIISYNKGVSIQLEQLSYTSCVITNQNFLYSNITNLTIDNLIFRNIQISNSTFLHIQNLFSDQLYYVVIKNLKFFGCQFLNMQFFQIDEKQNSYISITFEDLYFSQCTFQQSTFVSFQSEIELTSKVFLVGIHFEETEFYNTNFMRLEPTKGINLEKAYLKNIYFLNSNLFILFSSFYFNEVDMNNITFLNGSFIQTKKSLSFQTYDFKLKNLLMQNIYFEKLSVLNFVTFSSTNIEMIEINQINIKSNDGKLCFMFFSGSDVLIQNLQIKNLEEMSNFCLQSISKIQICGIKLMQNKIYQSSISLLNISNFQKTTLSDFEISQLNTSNQQLILIESLNSFNNDDQLELNLENINCFNNFFKKVQLNTQVTVLSIQTQFSILINLQKLNFTNNLIIHSINDQLINSPGLLLIDCQKGHLIVHKCSISNNIIGNSPQSLWFLLVQNIEMDQIQIQNVNQNYLDGQIDYEIQSIGGFSRIVTQNLTVTNSQFQNILSQSGSCFYIQMKSEGILNFYNLKISSSISKTTTIPVAKGGSIYIDCSDSSLNLILNNLTINYSVSEHVGGFIYLISSGESNSIILKDIIAQNIISPLNSFLLYDCSSSAGNNSILVQNLKFLIELNVVQSLIETEQLMVEFENTKQGFLILINCNITINNFIFEGMAYIPLFYIQFSQKLILNNIQIINAEVQGKNLIYVLDLNNNIKNSKKLEIFMENINIHNSKFNLDLNNQTNLPQSFLKFNIISSLSNVFIYVHKLIVTNNICYECQSGLVQFQASNELFKISIQHLVFLQNECGSLSCLELNLPQAQLVSLKEGKLIRNSGGYGAAINFKALYLKISKLIFLENSAKYQGGAFSIYTTPEKFVNWSQINLLSNKASFGGAIMLVNTTFSFEFYIQNCLFFQNKAQQEINSISENPSSLQLEIFKYAVETIRIKNNDSIFEKPNLNKYQLADSKIYIPSGQQISTYKRVQNQSLNYFPYDIDMKVFAINSLEEKQYFEKSENCSITIHSNNSSVKLYEKIVSFTQINNNESYLDLSQLTVAIDPYQSNENKTLSIYCKFLDNVNYSFTFEVEIFLCQMGEYYFQGQCLPCPAEKGYYSVKKNSQVCIKADPKVIIANTANQVNLFNGFWRPDHYTSEIQYCFKKPSSCEGGWVVADSSCYKGNIGALCEECDIYNIYGHGQYYKNQNYECEECGNFVGKVFFTFITTLIMIFSVSLTVNSVYTIFKSFKRLKMSSKYYDIIFRRNLDQSAALIKMIVNYFQILVGIHSFRLNLYFNFLDFLLPISNPFSGSTFSYDCFISLQHKIEILYTSFIIGLIFPTLCFIFYIILYLTQVYFHKTNLSSTIYFTALLYLLFYAQPNIIKEIGSLLASREISSFYYINKNVSYFFYTESHLKWIYFIILPFLIYFAFIFPLTLLYVLIKNRKYQNSEKFRQIWGYIFNDFKKDIYYWEIFKMSFRELIIFILALTEENVLLKGIIMFLLLLFYYIFAKLKQPYNIGSLNLFEQKNIFICSLVIIFSCLKYQLQQTDSQNFDFLIQLILFVLLIFFLFLLFIKLVVTYYNKLSARLDIMRLFIQKKFPDILKKSKFLRRILELHKEKEIRIAKHVGILRNTLRSQRKNEQASSLNSSNIGVAENSSLHSRHVSNICTHNYNYTLTLINQQGGDYVIK